MNEESIDFSEPDSERLYKAATRGDTTYSLSLLHGRIYLYRWTGSDSESVEFKGSPTMFNKFPVDNPALWFGIAGRFIANKGER